jgi:hypothetical protein
MQAFRAIKRISLGATVSLIDAHASRMQGMRADPRTPGEKKGATGCVAP